MSSIDRRTIAKHSRAPARIGEIRIRSKAARYRARFIKVAERARPHHRWMLYARWWWLQNKGPIPPGMRVIHADGDTLNDDPSNLALGTSSDIAAIWHFNNPEASDRNYAKVRRATAEHNRIRARIERTRRWMATSWYPVEFNTRVIHNVPFRKRCGVYERGGVERAEARGRCALSAALGWRGLPALQAFILSALREPQTLPGLDMVARVRELRELHGLGDLADNGPVHSAVCELRKRWLIRTAGPTRARRYTIEPAGTALFDRPSLYVPVRGARLSEERFHQFTIVLEDGQPLSRRPADPLALSRLIREEAA